MLLASMSWMSCMWYIPSNDIATGYKYMYICNLTFDTYAVFCELDPARQCSFYT